MFGKILIGLGFVAIPYLTLVNSRFDGREPRLMLAMFIASVLSLWGFYAYQHKKINNKWILIYLGFLFVSAWQAPQVILYQFGIQIGNFWIWKAIFLQIAFFGMWVTVSNMTFSEAEIRVYLNIMVWCGLCMALLCIGQSLGFTQWFQLGDDIRSTMTTKGHIIGFLGHPTKVGPYIAMLTPLAIYLKRYWATAIMFLAVCLTASQMAIGSMVLCLLILVALIVKKSRVFIGAFLIISAVILSLWYIKSPTTARKYINAQGRIGEWGVAINDIKEPFLSNKPYAWTGYGPGSFENTFPLKHDNKMRWLHNEYLELLRDTGIIGFSLFITALIYFIRNIVWNERNKYIFASFVCIAICAGGAYVWHLGEIAYNTIFLLGILNNEGLNHGKA